MLNGSAPVIIAAILAIISIALVVAMLRAIHQARGNTTAGERRHLLILAAVVVGFGITMIDTRVKPTIAPIDHALITEPPQPVIVNLADCPEDTRGMTGQIIMTIETRSDLAPLVTGCTRIAERSFVVDQGAPQ